MADQQPSIKQVLLRELFLFVGLFFAGLVLLPAAIYLVGGAVFGEYGGGGFSDFYGSISGRIRDGNPIAWFLVLTPYLGWQLLRLTRYLWRLTSNSGSGDSRTAQP